MICRKCNEELDLDKFVKNQNYCKGCHNHRARELRKLKKEGLWNGRDNAYLKLPKPCNSKTEIKNEDGIDYKKCSTCKEWKTYDMYYRYNKSRDGLFAKCKDCKKIDAVKYQEKYKDGPIKANPHIDVDGILSKKCNRCEEIKSLNLFPSNTNSWDKLKTICKVCHSNTQQIRAKDKYHNDPEYKKKELQRLKEQRERWRKTRIDYNIKNNLRSRIRGAMRGIVKSQKTMELLGCTMQEFLSYMESKFDETMNWQNYGGLNGWQIDHVVACCHFDLTDPEEQKKCFHYTNLQPLSAEDNRKKSHKLDWKKNN